jgi:hypothetical protein
MTFAEVVLITNTFAFLSITAEQWNVMRQLDFLHEMHSLACLLTCLCNARFEMYKYVSLLCFSVFTSEHYSAKKNSNITSIFSYTF